ncbi:tetratricopeptide repeat protein [Acidaminobacter sp. JC074]|uniref:tetratricopeptide repeat protein n=1 Tax=Acidaminobacter sp. JC074 TaxID=2530199 RepID=UPI001F0FE55C|nr:tetratricopeptide repeat protein [Acidaminobacter sp. JC074]MCH4886291.1 tetratricopeptide repeat protein [Acidaminobacter sp. JC074]
MSGTTIMGLVKLFFKLDRANLDNKLYDYRLALQDNNLEEAERLLWIHLDKYVSDEVALCELAVILKGKGQVNEAIKLLERAVKAHASYAGSRYQLGKLYLEKSDFSSAETYLHSAFSMSQTSDYSYHLAVAHRGLNDIKKSVHYLKKAIKLDKSNKNAYAMLIEIYKLLGKDNESEKYQLLLDQIC